MWRGGGHEAVGGEQRGQERALEGSARRAVRKEQKRVRGRVLDGRVENGSVAGVDGARGGRWVPDGGVEGAALLLADVAGAVGGGRAAAAGPEGAGRAIAAATRAVAQVGLACERDHPRAGYERAGLADIRARARRPVDDVGAERLRAARVLLEVAMVDAALRPGDVAGPRGGGGSLIAAARDLRRPAGRPFHDRRGRVLARCAQIAGADCRADHATPPILAVSPP